jgi:Zn-dependent protease with chaperone function
VHQRCRHRDILIGAAIVALPLIYRFSHLSAIAGVPWAIRGPLLVWLTPVVLYLLWRRFESTTDTEAAEITGDRQAVLDAPLRIAEFNVIALYWLKFERRFRHGKTDEPEVAEPHAAKSLVSADS